MFFNPKIPYQYRQNDMFQIWHKAHSGSKEYTVFFSGKNGIFAIKISRHNDSSVHLKLYVSKLMCINCSYNIRQIEDIKSNFLNKILPKSRWKRQVHTNFLRIFKRQHFTEVWKKFAPWKTSLMTICSPRQSFSSSNLSAYLKRGFYWRWERKLSLRKEDLNRLV